MSTTAAAKGEVGAVFVVFNAAIDVVSFAVIGCPIQPSCHNPQSLTFGRADRCTAWCAENRHGVSGQCCSLQGKHLYLELHRAQHETAEAREYLDV